MNEPNTQSVLHLLENVTIIKNKYDDIAKITGENFNIFSVFNKEYHENYHSALISELLNEKGSHGQGRLYLDLFIPILNKRINDRKSGINEISNFINSTSVTEKVTDINDRIDIYIESENQIILIENKIGANDQDLQLKRYYDFVNNKGKAFVIFYLWKNHIDVDKYNDSNTFGEGNEVREKTISISYKEDVKAWIEECIKSSATLPLVRETLIQYLHIINKLTEQSTNHKMSDDINKLLLLGDNLKTAETIKIEFDNTIKFLENDFRNALSLRLKNILTDIKVSDFVIKFEINEDSGGLYYGAFISKEGKEINPLTESTFDSIILNFKNQSDTTFKINTNHIFLGWINIIGDNQKYINIPNENKVLFYKDSTELNKFLDIIYSKCQAMYNLIK
jgi:hypothetical protein